MSRSSGETTDCWDSPLERSIDEVLKPSIKISIAVVVVVAAVVVV